MGDSSTRSETFQNCPWEGSFSSAGDVDAVTSSSVIRRNEPASSILCQANPLPALGSGDGHPAFFTASAVSDTFTFFDSAYQIPFRLLLLLLFSSAAQSFYATMISLVLSKEVGYRPLDITRYWMYISVCSWISPFVSHRLCGVYLKAKYSMVVSVLCCGFISVTFGIFPSTTNRACTLIVLSAYSQLCLASQYTLLTEYVVEAGRCESGEDPLKESHRQTQLLSQAMVWRSVGTVMGAIIQCYSLFFWPVRTVLVIAGILFFILAPLVWTLPVDVRSFRNTRQKGYDCRALEQRLRDSTVRAMSIIRQSVFQNSSSNYEEVCFAIVLGFVLLFTAMPDSSNVYYNYLFFYRFSSWMYPVLNGIGYLGSTFGAYIFSKWMNDPEGSLSARFKASKTVFFVFSVGILFWLLSHICNVWLIQLMERHGTLFSDNFLMNGAFDLMPLLFVAVMTFLMAMFSRLSFLPAMVISTAHTPLPYRMLSVDVFGLVATVGGSLSALATHVLVVVLSYLLPQSPLKLLTWTIAICGATKLFLIPLAYMLPNYNCAVDIINGDGNALTNLTKEYQPSDMIPSTPVQRQGGACLSPTTSVESAAVFHSTLSHENGRESEHTSSSSVSPPHPREGSEVVISDDAVSWEGYVFHVPENYASCMQYSE